MSHNISIMLKSYLEEIVALQRDVFLKKDIGMRRENYSRIKPVQSYVYVVSGIRRSGKSTLLSQYIRAKHKNVFFLNFDDIRLADFKPDDFTRLDEVIKESRCRVLFFDEIQVIDGWERYIRQKLDESFRVYITGSNASMLSRELGTKLTGRHISHELLPFSYKEFLRFLKKKPSAETTRLYMNSGGFPEYLKTNNPEIRPHLFQDILIRDIAVRNSIRDIKSLQRLALYLISNVGQRVSGTRLKNIFGMGSATTALDYLSYFETAYLFYFVPLFSYSQKVQNVNPRKVYAPDTGLISAASASFSKDDGPRFENTIFLHLKRKYNDIYYFSEKKECDFVACINGKARELVQVCYSLDNENTQRECDGLYEAMAFFGIKQGRIVTLHQSDLLKKDNMEIEVLPAYRFLMEK